MAPTCSSVIKFTHRCFLSPTVLAIITALTGQYILVERGDIDVPQESWASLLPFIVGNRITKTARHRATLARGKTVKNDKGGNAAEHMGGCENVVKTTRTRPGIAKIGRPCARPSIISIQVSTLLSPVASHYSEAFRGSSHGHVGILGEVGARVVFSRSNL
jgi:hypothetical protein